MGKFWTGKGKNFSNLQWTLETIKMQGDPIGLIQHPNWPNIGAIILTTLPLLWMQFLPPKLV